MRKPTIWVSDQSDTNRAVQHRRLLETRNFGFRKQRNRTILGEKTKVLICAFVFTYADCWFSHKAAQIFTFSLKSPNVFLVLYLLKWKTLSHVT